MRAGTDAQRLVVLGALSLASACNPTPSLQASAEPSSAPGAPAPSSAATATASVVIPSEYALAGAKAWTDPVVIDRLVSDCRWAPPEEPGAEKPPPLSCALAIPEQSCVPDPCFEARNQKCEPACKATCDGCGDTCAAGCESCKASCADDACRRTCATRCGECRQACLSTKDQCATGKCRLEQRACDAKLAAEWTQGGCTAACARFRACDACDADFESAACIKCRARAMGQCPTRFEMMCAFGVDPTRPDE